MFRAPAPSRALAIVAFVLIAGAPATAPGSPSVTVAPILSVHSFETAGVSLVAADALSPAVPEAAAGPPDAPHVQEPADPATAAPPRPHPLRAYAVPAARSGQWGFTPQVTRWLPLVESELAALRARRLDHPELVPELVLAVIAAESAGDPLALSTSDAIGLMQLLPTTFSDMIPTLSPSSPTGAVSPPDPPDPFDPVLNVRAGILYLRQLLIRHDGDVAWAVAGYHAGINASARARWEEQPLYDVTLDYVAQVLTLRERGVPPAAALWASLPAWPASVPRPLSVAAQLAPESAPTTLQLDADVTIMDLEPVLTDLTIDLAAGDETTPAPAQAPSTPVPGSPPPATTLSVRSAASEGEVEREDGRDLAVRRVAVASSPSPTPTPTPTPSPTPSPTSSPSPTVSAVPSTPSPTGTASPTTSSASATMTATR